ncbi:chaplin [Streptomyces sp. NPDC059398]|uniref:chaplin n=1 Tax=Streptomyces sp. NPDC059398 TaxID=3346820 RepID=UPI003698784E
MNTAKKAALVLATAGLAAGGAPGPRVAHAGARGGAGGAPGGRAGHQVGGIINIGVNVCGNTVDVIGLLNPAFGNTCINK